MRARRAFRSGRQPLTEGRVQGSSFSVLVQGSAFRVPFTVPVRRSFRFGRLWFRRFWFRTFLELEL